MRKHVRMWTVLVASIVLFGLVGLARAQDHPTGQDHPAANPVVVIKTNMGIIKIELFAGKMPGTTKNFLRNVDGKYYNGLTFHRAMPGSLIQGGKYPASMTPRQARPAVKAETNPDLKSTRGSVQMIVKGTKEAPTIRSQFIIRLRDRSRSPSPFGKVIEGMEVVDKISNVKTGKKGGHSMVPLEPVVMESVTRAETK